MKKNEGIILTGGNLTAGQLAVGKSASITVDSASQKNELNDCVESLLAVLESEKSRIEKYEDVKQAAGTVKQELEKENPDKNVLTVLLSMISNAVPAISNVTKAIRAVKEAMALVLK